MLVLNISFFTKMWGKNEDDIGLNGIFVKVQLHINTNAFICDEKKCSCFYFCFKCHFFKLGPFSCGHISCQRQKTV